MQNPGEVISETTKASKAISTLRLVGFIEGWSFLILLGIAMPLKYLAGFPLAVQIVGMIHGLLFIWYVVSVVRVKKLRNWPRERYWEALAVSIIPFGTFIFDRKLKVEYNSLQ